MSDTEAASAAILAALKSGEKLQGLPPQQMPRDMDEGFALQQAVIAGVGEQIVGWKIACTAAPVQELYGVPRTIFRCRVRESSI